RLAAEQAEAERLAAEQAEAERLAAEQAEAERLAAEQAEAEKLAAEQAEAERLAAEKAEAERIAAEQAEAERLAAEQAEAERLAAEQAEAERLAAEQAEAERLAAEKAEAEKLAAEKAEAEKLAAEQAETEAKAKAEASRGKSKKKKGRTVSSSLDEDEPASDVKVNTAATAAAAVTAAAVATATTVSLDDDDNGKTTFVTIDGTEELRQKPIPPEEGLTGKNVTVRYVMETSELNSSMLPETLKAPDSEKQLTPEEIARREAEAEAERAELLAKKQAEAAMAELIAQKLAQAAVPKSADSEAKAAARRRREALAAAEMAAAREGGKVGPVIKNSDPLEITQPGMDDDDATARLEGISDRLAKAVEQLTKLAELGEIEPILQEVDGGLDVLNSGAVKFKFMNEKGVRQVGYLDRIYYDYEGDCTYFVTTDGMQYYNPKIKKDEYRAIEFEMMDGAKEVNICKHGITSIYVPETSEEKKKQFMRRHNIQDPLG
ncbi:MAG: hypothetical protein J5825_08725, partial [Lachnospiraceae bacterium]|nr:hypothetical protein [Lachnospiraceae bacterium]